jgi:hypothetical protein
MVPRLPLWAGSATVHGDNYLSSDDGASTISHKFSLSLFSHKCLMARGKSHDSSSSDDEDKPSIDELVHVVKCFEDVCTEQKDQLNFEKISCLAPKMIINVC